MRRRRWPPLAIHRPKLTSLRTTLIGERQLPSDVGLRTKTWGAAVDAVHNLGRVEALAKELLPNPMLVA